MPYRAEPPPRTTSMRSMLSNGTLLQYTHPPKGSFNGTPSNKTRVLLTPLGPMPRRDTPCVVGLATRLLLRRNKLKPGTSRNRSSTVWAVERSMSSRVSTVVCVGTSARRCSTRPADTTQVAGRRARRGSQTRRRRRRVLTSHAPTRRRPKVIHPSPRTRGHRGMSGGCPAGCMSLPFVRATELRKGKRAQRA